MFNFDILFVKKAINFDQAEIEKGYFVVTKFCCASNGAIKNVNNRKKKNFFQNVFNKIV